MSARKYSLLTAGNLGAQINESFNFIVANIYSHVILKLLEDIPRLLAAGGIFVGSGIIQENKNAVLAAMEKLKFEILETAAEEDWVAIAGQLRAKRKGHGAKVIGHSA